LTHSDVCMKVSDDKGNRQCVMALYLLRVGCRLTIVVLSHRNQC